MVYKSNKILNVMWKSGGIAGSIGIITTECNNAIKVYTGISEDGNTEERDIKYIIDWGSCSDGSEYVHISNKINSLKGL